MIRTITTILAAAAISASACAADFFSTEECDKLFELGARVGVNTSNRTVSTTCLGGYDHQSWGTGFTAGVVADLNIRDYIAIQPGVFFESLSGSYTFIEPTHSEISNPHYYFSQAGNRHSYNITVPVLASLRFNVTDDIRWLVEAGPYVSFVMSSKLTNKEVVTNLPPELDYNLFSQKPAPVDFGFKLGTGLELFGHYYVGVHYQAGCTKAWKDRKYDVYREIFSGRTKTWNFTIGYNF